MDIATCYKNGCQYMNHSNVVSKAYRDLHGQAQPVQGSITVVLTFSSFHSVHYLHKAMWENLNTSPIPPPQKKNNHSYRSVPLTTLSLSLSLSLYLSLPLSFSLSLSELRRSTRVLVHLRAGILGQLFWPCMGYY